MPHPQKHVHPQPSLIPLQDPESPVRTLQIELPAIGEPESLRAVHQELPEPGPGQALVRVEATGVSFAEQQMRRGKYYDQPAFPFVPGYDLVGVVERLGPPLAADARAADARTGLAPGTRVAGPAQQESVAALGATPVDYRHEDVPARVRELAPEGVAAVFDHVGGDGIGDSWRMLARGGTLVSYGTAATKDLPGDPRRPVLLLLARLTAWNLLPNGRSASFFNLWAGKRLRPRRYRAQVRDDLTQLLAQLADGRLTAQVAGRFPLTDAGAALRFAEQGGHTGKVVLLATASAA